MEKERVLLWVISIVAVVAIVAMVLAVSNSLPSSIPSTGQAGTRCYNIAGSFGEPDSNGMSCGLETCYVWVSITGHWVSTTGTKCVQF